MDDVAETVSVILDRMRRLASTGYQDGEMLTGLANAYTALMNGHREAQPSLGSEIAVSLRDAREKAKTTEVQGRVARNVHPPV